MKDPRKSGRLERRGEHKRRHARYNRERVRAWMETVASDAYVFEGHEFLQMDPKTYYRHRRDIIDEQVNRERIRRWWEENPTKNWKDGAKELKLSIAIFCDLTNQLWEEYVESQDDGE